MLLLAVLFLSIALAAPALGYPVLFSTALGLAAILFAAHVTVGLLVKVLDRHGEVDRRILQHA